MQIQAYLDNVFDVGGLLEDAETKNVALEKVEELEEHLSHVGVELFLFACEQTIISLAGADQGSTLASRKRSVSNSGQPDVSMKLTSPPPIIAILSSFQLLCVHEFVSSPCKASGHCRMWHHPNNKHHHHHVFLIFVHTLPLSKVTHVVLLSVQRASYTLACSHPYNSIGLPTLQMGEGQVWERGSHGRAVM